MFPGFGREGTLNGISGVLPAGSLPASGRWLRRRPQPGSPSGGHPRYLYVSLRPNPTVWSLWDRISHPAPTMEYKAIFLPRKNHFN